MVELASALATLRERPKRSLLFVSFFGEEQGLLGSRYYGRHPLVPVEKTVADVNLEQVGRTDELRGPAGRGRGLTGLRLLRRGQGLRRGRRGRGGEGRTSTRATATPSSAAATTRPWPTWASPPTPSASPSCSPTTTAPADHWDKVDYANMARIDRVVARAVLAIADDPEPPKWNADNPRAASLPQGGRGPPRPAGRRRGVAVEGRLATFLAVPATGAWTRPNVRPMGTRRVRICPTEAPSRFGRLQFLVHDRAVAIPHRMSPNPGPHLVSRRLAEPADAPPCPPRNSCSPAGDRTCLVAAVENGADAVYFGLQRHNARARAANFDGADLPEVMALLHRRGVRGYVTLNTLVFPARAGPTSRRSSGGSPRPGSTR